MSKNKKEVAKSITKEISKDIPVAVTSEVVDATPIVPEEKEPEVIIIKVSEPIVEQKPVEKHYIMAAVESDCGIRMEQIEI